VSYLVDTNVISELRKGDRRNPRVTAWYATVVGRDLYLSTLVLGELRKGVELARAKDIEKSLALATRDERDVSGLGAIVLNPFRFGER